MPASKFLSKAKILSALIVAATAGIALSTGQAAAQMTPKIPYLEEWQGSPHAKADAEAFVHWNEEDDKMVPEACAKCHSTSGFQDYIGADGSTEWTVDAKVPVGEVIECVACHNPATRFLTQVTFPSGTTVKDIGDEARCMTCHQGRESAVSINNATKDMEADAVSDKLKFINIHYRAAAATMYGTVAKGGFEYPGQAYGGVYNMDEGAETCIDCHNPHTTELNVDDCAFCHRDIRAEEDFKLVRSKDSKGDYDGDGDADEGIAQEIETLHEALYAAIQKYAADVAGTPIGYDDHNYPYFFADTNGDGAIDESEAKYPNAYKSFTPRLLRAVYNYQFVAKDPGAYAHNPHYIMQLMYDSLADLATQTEIAMDGMVRP